MNEDLAATAVLGTQQINHEKANKQGVFAMWMGRGRALIAPGMPFAMAIWPALLPTAECFCWQAMTTPANRQPLRIRANTRLMDAMIPTLNPAGIQDNLEFGLLGWAMSRYSGAWAAIKLVADTMESSAVVDVSESAAFSRPPVDFEQPPGGLNIRWPDTPQEMERRLHNVKIPAALAFARANRLDRVTLGGARPRLGIVTTGKSYLDVLQALETLGLGLQRAAELGLAIYKVGYRDRE